MVEDVLVNRNMKFSLEIVDEVCRELSTSDGRWSDVVDRQKILLAGGFYGPRGSDGLYCVRPSDHDDHDDS